MTVLHYGLTVTIFSSSKKLKSVKSDIDAFRSAFSGKVKLDPWEWHAVRLQVAEAGEGCDAGSVLVDGTCTVCNPGNIVRLSNKSHIISHNLT